MNKELLGRMAGYGGAMRDIQSDNEAELPITKNRLEPPSQGKPSNYDAISQRPSTKQDAIFSDIDQGNLVKKN